MKKLVTVVELVTPEQAEQYLNTMVINRKLREGWVSKLAAMMRDGHFRVTHQGLAFNTLGQLIDGQHRLWAIIEANIPVRISVTRNVPDDSMLYIDSGCNRSDADALTISGRPTTCSEAAVGRLLFKIYATQHMGCTWMSKGAVCDRDSLVRFLELNHEAIVFAAPPKGSKKWLRGSIIQAVVATFWWTADRDRLKMFLEQLHSGVVSNGERDSAVLRFRDFVSNNAFGTGTQTIRKEHFDKTATAVAAYLEFRHVKSLQTRKDALPLLPLWDGLTCVGEKEDDAPAAGEEQTTEETAELVQQD